jgi:hypothetical protein
MADPYEVLGVPEHADEAQVRSAYRELLMEHHPDQGGSTERFMQIKDAYERIVDGGSITGPLTEGGGTVAKRRRVTATGTAVRIDGGLELVAEAEGLVVRLTTLTEELPTERMLPSHVEHGRRLGACFHVINDTGQPVTWKARRVRFLGDGGEPHLPSVYRPKEDELPDRWRGDDVDVEHGESVRSFILSRTLPEETEVETVVYDQQSSTGTDYRVEFDVDRSVRDELDRAPFQ